MTATTFDKGPLYGGIHVTVKTTPRVDDPHRLRAFFRQDVGCILMIASIPAHPLESCISRCLEDAAELSQ